MENDKDSWRPWVLDPKTEKGVRGLREVRSRTEVEVVDTIVSQLDEYIRLEHPGSPPEASELETERNELIRRTGAVGWDDFGNWVYYPWVSKLVHVLPEEMFVSVRTDRNRDKITREEQLQLSGKRIGVIGMSVGRSVATTLALERVFGELRLADFDVLDLSNLNRLKAPVWDLGLRKTVSVARNILETDPYLELQLLHEGVTKENLEAFALVDGKLDVIIDECDSLEVKIACREFAKAHRIPVVMETSDRGMLDVERFDLDPERAIFHGKLEGFDVWNDIQSPELKWNMLMTLVDYEALSEKARISLAQIGRSISTWPQLASAVVLGGGTVTDTVRRILLGEPVESGRYYIDVHALTKATKQG